MREHQTPQIIANRVRMIREVYRSKSVMLVEGSTDKRPYQVFVCDQRCHIQGGSGRDNALEAGRILLNTHFAGFIVLVDQDDWIWRGGHPNDNHTAWTDGRDLESTLLLRGLLERIITNY